MPRRFEHTWLARQRSLHPLASGKVGQAAGCEDGDENEVRCCNDSPNFIDERLVREQRIMSNVPVFVGLDYHQDSIQVCVLNQQGDVLLNRSAKNDRREVGRIVQPLALLSVSASRPAAERQTFEKSWFRSWVGTFRWVIRPTSPESRVRRIKPTFPIPGCWLI